MIPDHFSSLNHIDISKVIKRTVEGINKENLDFKGFIFAGLMNVEGEPYVIEYNVRMGAPETQVVMPMMNTSLFDIIDASLNQGLKSIDYKNKQGYCATVVVAADGYPHKYDKGFVIEGLNDLGDDLVFHAGTSLNSSNQFVTSGGRVLR